MDYIKLKRSAEEALSKGEVINIEHELKKLQESKLQVTDDNLRFEFHILIYRILEFLKREAEALEELNSIAYQSKRLYFEGNGVNLYKNASTRKRI